MRHQSIFLATQNFFNQFSIYLYATGTIFCKHIFLFCATLNIFSQPESSFGCHIIFFVATRYFFVTHLILLPNSNFYVKYFFNWHNTILCNTRFFCADWFEHQEHRETKRKRCVAIKKVWKRHAVLHLSVQSSDWTWFS